MKEPVAILRTGVVCPVGLDAEQAAASILAGVPRKQESHFRSKRGDPIILSSLPEEILPPLVDELIDVRARPRGLATRLLRLASPALQEVMGGRTGLQSLPHHAAVPLLLAVPEPLPGGPALVTGEFLEQIVRQAKVPVDLEASRLFPLGRAGLFAAAQDACARVLSPGIAEFAIVGGVDSYIEATRLARLEREDRLLTAGVQDAFTPGEGAAFLLLATKRACLRHGLEPLAWLLAAGRALEPGHRYSEVPNRGHGLTTAFAEVFRNNGHADPVRLVMAGFNGESLHTKEWGIAAVRHRECLAGSLRIEHPGEYTGDAGAALAPIMLAITALELRKKRLEGPGLVWASSDGEERGAALIHAQ